MPTTPKAGTACPSKQLLITSGAKAPGTADWPEVSALIMLDDQYSEFSAAAECLSMI